MRQSLQERLETQVRYETVMRKAAKFDFDAVQKLGAMLYVNAGREIDADRIKECKRILKGKTGFLSNFRGTLESVVLVKMSLADDPAAFIDDVMAAYERLKAGRLLPGEMCAMASMTIVENCPLELRDSIIDRTREAYTQMKGLHPFLTDESDLSLIALMLMAGKDVEKTVVEAEGLFRTMKDNYRIGSDAAQSAAMVLALSDKPTDQKLQAFFSLFDACKQAGHATSRNKAMTIYAAYADAEYDLSELVATIGEVDEWLKKQKGYGALGVGTSERRLFAASMVLEDMQVGNPAAASSATGAVAQAVIEELVLILMTLILVSAIAGAVAASS